MIKLIVWIIVGVLVLSFFGISLESLVEAPTTQENVGFLKELTLSGWEVVKGFFESIINLVRRS